MSDPRNQSVAMAPDIGRVAELDRRPTLVEASLASARSISQTMTGVIQPQIDAHAAAIATAQGQIGTQGVAIAGAKAQIDAHTAAIAKAETQIGAHGEAIAGTHTRIEAQNHTLTGVQSHLTNLSVASAKHEEALTIALLGESGHVRRLDGAVGDLIVRVALLEAKCGEDGAAGDEARTTPDQTEQMRRMNEALTERVTAMEGTIRQFLEHGPQGGPRTTRR